MYCIIFYKCGLGIIIFGGIILLTNYCYDFYNFLKEKTTDKVRYSDWKFAGQMFVGTGIAVEFLGFILSIFNK